MAFAKATADDMLGGRFDRLASPENEVIWQYTSRDESTVYLAYFHILSGPNMPFRRARMIGLAPAARYALDDSDEVYHGDALMHSGMPMPLVSVGEKSPGVRYMPDGDFSAHLFVFKRQDV